MSLSQGTEVLSDEQRIASSIEERQRIIISRLCLTASTPLAETIEVCTESQHDRSCCHHRLVEMRRCKLCLHLRITSYHYTIKLHIAHGRSTESFFKQLIEQFSRNIVLLILTDSPSILYTIHILTFFCKHTHFPLDTRRPSRKN